MTSAPDVEPLRVRVMGVTVEVGVADEETRARLARQWSRALLADGADPGRLVEGPFAAGGDPATDQARDYRLTSLVTVAALRATTGERLNLHAGGLADDAGRVLAIVGESGAGKTTATRALAKRLHYLSDETVSIQLDRTVLPHPKPLSVLIDPDDPYHKEQLSPDELGLLTTPESGILTRIVLIQRGLPSPQGLFRLDTVDALMPLIEQSSSLSELDEPLPTLLRLVQECGGVMALEYDEIGDHLDELVGLLDQDPEPGPDLPTVHHPGSDRSPRSYKVAEGDPRVHRLPWVDALQVGDEVVVLLEGRAVRLTDLTATIWLHLDEPRAVEELVARAQEVHGAHADAADIVEQALAVLVEENVAVRGSLA